MPLTVPQKKYIVDRINELADEKERIVRESFQHPDSQEYKIKCIKKLPVKDTMQQIIKNLRDSTSFYAPSWGTVPISSILGEKVVRKIDDSYTQLCEEISERRDELIKQVMTKTTAIKDIIMLGPEEQAHKMIDDFKSWHPE